MHRFKVSIVVQLRIQVFCLGHDSVIGSTSAWTLSLILADKSISLIKCWRQHSITSQKTLRSHNTFKVDLISKLTPNMSTVRFSRLTLLGSVSSWHSVQPSWAGRSERSLWSCPLHHHKAHVCLYTAQFYDDAANHILTIQEDAHVEQISKWDVQVILKQDSFKFGNYCFLLRNCF